jgi:cytochrome P450
VTTEGGPIPHASRFDGIRHNLGHVLPRVLQGTFRPRKRWVSLWSRLHPDFLTVRFMSRLRRKYGDYVYIDMLGNRTLVVLSPVGVRSVLDRSPGTYAEPLLKRRAMSHFQPGALTISRGSEWQDRRRFNEAVLETPSPIHSEGARFHRVAEEEAARVLEKTRTLEWSDMEAAFEAITLRVVFGDRAREAGTLTNRLRALMLEANRPFGLGNSSHFEPFYQELRAHLEAAEPHTLAGRCPHAPRTETTRVENQVPHWLFATRDTLPLNVLRTLAAIAAHPAVQDQARVEVARLGRNPDGVSRMAVLRGCLHEAMRLWPTTPILLREAVVDDELEGRRVEQGSLVMIPNGYHHRNAEAHPFADSFRPDIWNEPRPRPTFNHLSSGPQKCAGGNLAVFLGTSFLAALLGDSSVRLEAPALDPERPLPHALDPYGIRIRVGNGGH